MIDTHTHYLHPDFDKDRQEILQKVWNSGVTAVLEIGYTPTVAQDALLWARQEPRVRIAAGIHPHEAGKYAPEDIERIARVAGESEVVAIGEVGLDFFRDWAPRDRQKDLFRRMIRLSLELRKPLVLHVRDAFDEAVDILLEEGGGRYGGVFHCHQGDREATRRACELGFKLGLGGSITYWSASKRRLLAEMPIEAMLLETDAPWLCPAPRRGQRNDSSHLTYIVNVIAAEKGLTPEEVIRVTSTTARELFPGLGAAGADTGRLS